MAKTNKKTLLVDVDSTIPNLALMHISAWKKAEGHEVGFGITDPDEIYASVVFDWNRHKLDGLRFLYPDATIDRGGSGVSLSKRLPAEVDLMMPDYSLYPDCDFDVGFTTRGCVRNCPFCVVPRKEGRFKVVQHPREFHDPSHRGVMLLDNNILADKGWFFEVTDWIISQGMKVDFNQGLDLRLMDRDVAKRIRELSRMTTWRFAFDSLDYTDEVIDGIRMLQNAGVKVRSSSLVYVYVDSDDDFDSALERLRILRGLDAMPYVMLNRNSRITPRMRALKRWTRPQIFYSTEWEGYNGSVRGHNADRITRRCGTEVENES